MTEVHFSEQVPGSAAELGVAGTAILIYDEVLDDIDAFTPFRDTFELRYPVTAGEQLKDVAAFGEHAAAVTQLVGGASPGDLTVVAAGGGSVGDFGGFLASVLKRGVRLTHVPTTWLSAIDSAHGGKTALNVGGVKNQIGTFHPAAEVWVLKPLLDGVPPSEARSAWGELVKTALLAGGDLFDACEGADASADAMWPLLPAAVAVKTAVVNVDPTETTGQRRILNLGHTFGHAVEAHYSIPHGIAVGCGLRFTVEWSRHLGDLDEADAGRVVAVLDRFPEFSDLPADPELGRDELERLLEADKKSQGPGTVQFVFLTAIGSVDRRNVAVSDIVDEAARQGWL